MNKYLAFFSMIVITQMMGCTAILWNNNSGGLYELKTGKYFQRLQRRKLLTKIKLLVLHI